MRKNRSVICTNNSQMSKLSDLYYRYIETSKQVVGLTNWYIGFGAIVSSSDWGLSVAGQFGGFIPSMIT